MDINLADPCVKNKNQQDIVVEHVKQDAYYDTTSNN